MDARERGEFFTPIVVPAAANAGDFSNGRDRIEEGTCVKGTADVDAIDGWWWRDEVWISSGLLKRSWGPWDDASRWCGYDCGWGIMDWYMSELVPAYVDTASVDDPEMPDCIPIW